jgi:putative PEP-CTERM system TPR-repeat lipoprotein
MRLIIVVAAAVLWLSTGALITGCAEGNPEEMLASGKAYLAKKDTNAAVIQFRNALQTNPKLAEARFLLGKTLLEIGDVAGAEKELRKALDLKYSPDEVTPALARSLVLLGQHKEATDEFSTVTLTAAHANAELQSALGTAYLNLGQRDRAGAAFAAALAALPTYAPAHIGQAQLAALSRDYVKALKLLEPALASSPNHPEGWHAKGDIFLARGDEPGALAAYRKAVEVKRDYLPAHVRIASLLMQQGELEEASKQLASMKQIAPKHPQTLYLQAQLAYRQKNFAAARDAIQQHLAAAPQSLPGFALAGAIYFELKSYGLAEEHLLKVLQRAPGHVQTRQGLSLTYLRSGDPGKALEVLKPVLGGIDKDAQMLSLAGQVFMLNGEPAQASEYFAKAAALDPSDKAKRVALGESLVASGETDRGLRELERTAAADTGIAADLALAATYMKRREYSKALSAIAAMEKKQPDNPAPHDLRGTVLLATRDNAGARRSFERALELNPAYFPAVAKLANLDLADKKPQAARQRLEAVLAKNPQHRNALLALAELGARTGRPSSETASFINKAIAAHPNDPVPRLAMVSHYISTKDSKKAVLAAQEALAAMPDRAEIVDAAGRAYQAAGETDQALAAYHKLTSLQPNSPQPHLRMAEVQIAAKDKEAASSSLQRALRLQPNLVAAQRGMIALHVDKGEVQQAVAVAREVQKQRPKQSIGYVFEGDIYAGGKKWTEAAQAYSRGLKQTGARELAARLYDLHVNSGQLGNAEQFAATWFKEHPKDMAFRLHLAQSAMLRKDYEAATQHYRKLLDRYSDKAVLLNNLAWASAQLKDPRAIDYAEQAYKLAPNDATVMDTLGTLLIDKGDTARGLQLLRQASVEAPHAPSIRLNLAKALVKAGQKDAARKELDELAKLGEKFSRHAEVKQLRREL